MTTALWRIAAGAWLLAIGLTLSAGAAAALADPGTGAPQDSGSTSANGTTSATGSTAGHGSGGSPHPASTQARVAVDAKLDDPPATAGAVPQRSSQSGSAATAAPASGETGTPHTLTATAKFDSTAEPAAPTSGPAPTADPGSSNDPAPKSDATATSAPTSVPTSAPAVAPTDDAALPSTAPPTTDPAPTTDTAAAPDAAAAAAATVEAPSPATPSHDSTASTVAADEVGAQSPATSDPVQQVTTQDPSTPTDTAPDPLVAASTDDLLAATAADIEPIAQLAADVPPDATPSLGTAVTAAEPITELVTIGRRSPGNRATAFSLMQILRFTSGTSGPGWLGMTTGESARMEAEMTTSPATGAGSDTPAALARASSMAMAARVSDDTELPEGLRVFLHSYGQLIVAASLSAMAAAALPGLAGIVIPTLAGMRIGYRQARAGHSLRDSGIARLAGSGPIGIVRSGSVVALRPRASRVARSSAESHDERVA